MSNLQVRIIDDFNEFLSLEGKWDSIVDSMEYPMPFLTHSWVNIWCKSFGMDKSLYIITVWDESNLIGILPLCKTTCRVLKLFNFPSLQSLTNEHCGAFNIICASYNLKAVVNTIKSHFTNNPNTWHIVALNGVQLDFGTVARLADTFSGRDTHVFVKPGNGSYYVDIKGTFEEYFTLLNKDFRETRKNKNNRMSQKGKVEFKATDAYDKEAINLFYNLENTGWKGERGTSIKISEVLVNFYNSMASTFSQKKQLLLSILYISGEPIASVYGLLFKGTFYFLKIGANYSYPEYKRISPGDAILYHLIKYCFDQKIKRFDFYGPCYPYEAHWTKAINRKYNIMIFNCKKPIVKLCVILKKAVNTIKQTFIIHKSHKVI